MYILVDNSNSVIDRFGDGSSGEGKMNIEMTMEAGKE